MKQKEKVTRKMLLQMIAAKSGLDMATVSKVYTAFVDSIVETVQNGNNISITGFGNFYLQKHKGHPVQFESHNSHVAEYALLKFSASDSLNKRLREPAHENK